MVKRCPLDHMVLADMAGSAWDKTSASFGVHVCERSSKILGGDEVRPKSDSKPTRAAQSSRDETKFL